MLPCDQHMLLAMVAPRYLYITCSELDEWADPEAELRAARLASEAYKLLRTKLQFSFADENDCHIIGLSSALSGEGKSLSAVNLAYTMSQLGKRVLLIDCDMRRPTLAEKLKIKKLLKP